MRDISNPVRRRCFTLLILHCAFQLVVSLNAASLSPIDVSAEIEIIRERWRLPGLMGMAVKNGRIIAQGAAGVRREGDTSPLLITDPINIASCTKWMTATVAGRLVDRGVIRWDTRVRDIFTNYTTLNASFHNATLEQFLAHRTGVQQGITFEKRYWGELFGQTGSTAELERWVAERVLRDAPEVTPGSYLYANQGYTVAAVMMAVASGKEWRELIVEEIFEPLRMSSARLGLVYNDEVPAQFAVGHDLASGATTAIPRSAPTDYVLQRYHAAVAAGGYAICTLQDWAKYLHTHATSDVTPFLKRATAMKLAKPFVDAEGYGLGVGAVNRSWATPGQALTHSGDIFGHDTVFWMAPGRDFVVMVFTNCRSADNETASGLDEVASLLVGRYSGSAARGPFLEAQSAGAVRRAGDDFAFDFATIPGVRYDVKISTDLETWTNTSVVATNFVSEFLDRSPTPQKFFQAAPRP